MKSTKRFDQAVLKLYQAFHDNTLNPECCKQCAVGNILDNTDAWKHLSDHHGSSLLNYVGKVNEAFGKRFGGYRPSELLQIEIVFLKGCGFELPLSPNSIKPSLSTSKDILFNGLEATVKFLGGLDNISDLMDCSAIFDYSPKHKCILVT